MAPIPSYEKVEFKTIDGTTLRGWLYAASERGPAIVMTPGFNCVKEMLLPEVAEKFQSLGYTALIYDPRSIGDSDGLPRNQIDPLRQIEDLADIVTYITTLSNVDPGRVSLWGMSFGGTISACAAAIDRRVKALVMICPILSFFKAEKREKAFAQLIKDRQSQIRGNEGFTLPPFNSKGENPIGMAGSGGVGGVEAYGFMNAVIDRGAPNFRNRITLQSYYKLALWQPKELLKLLDVTPVMMVTPELDAMSPPDEQIEAFEKFQQPKKFILAKEKGHLTVLSGHGSDEIIDSQIDFIQSALEGTLKATS